MLPGDLDFAPPPLLDPLPPGDEVPPLELTGAAGGAGFLAGVDGFGEGVLVGVDGVCVKEGVV